MGYMGKREAFEDALADFSLAYAEQNERDHAAPLDAIRSRRVETRAEEERAPSPEGPLTWPFSWCSPA
jgi:hypothetical protein